MQKLTVNNRDKWRQWLAMNHDRSDGVWLVFFKKTSGRASVNYDEAVEEALCFGWIDSTIKKVNDKKYVRKFTPRKPGSIWSELNKKRVHKLVEQGLMTEVGRAKITAAKQSGDWEKSYRPVMSFDIPRELQQALSRNKKARAFFDQLAVSYRKQYIGWIATAKRPETRERRVKESIGLLAQGKKLGLK